VKALQEQQLRIMLTNGITKNIYHMNREGKSKEEHQVISKSKSLPSLLVD
jgi:hypothetical protein